MDEIRSNHNVVYRSMFHVVWCPKYLRPAVRHPPPRQQIKGRSSRLLGAKFSYVKSRMSTLWTNSYFVATIGGATQEAVKRMSKISATPRTLHYLPMAQAKGFSGAF